MSKVAQQLTCPDERKCSGVATMVEITNAHKIFVTLITGVDDEVKPSVALGGV
jgi:hypothetical protein